MATDATGYIKHHLTNLTYGKLPAGYQRTDYDGNVVELEQATWTMANSSQEAADMGFWAFHVDSLGWSIGLMLVLMWMFRSAAKKASLAVPKECRVLSSSLSIYQRHRKRIIPRHQPIGGRLH